MKKSFSAKTPVSPRTPSFKNAIMSLIQNVVNSEKKKGWRPHFFALLFVCFKKRFQGLASLFGGGNSPTSAVASGSGSAGALSEEFDVDWVCAVSVFFYNRVFSMIFEAKCACATMEAGMSCIPPGFHFFYVFCKGKGKWLWRSVATGVVAALSPVLYSRYLFAAFYDVIHRSNLLQSKVIVERMISFCFKIILCS